MTKQEILAEVEAKIRKDIPRLMELKEGCKVLEYKRVKIIVSCKNNSLIAIDYLNGGIGFLDKKNFQIIGHDIMLNDVLEWSLMNKLFNIELIHKTLRMKPFKNLLHLNDYGRWDLSKPYLKDQSEELLKFLYNITKDE